NTGMDELLLQEKYLLNFLTQRSDGLGYKEVKANTVSPQHIIVEDLKYFISETSVNKKSYRRLLKKYNNDESALLQEFMEAVNKRISESMNMGLFFHNNRSITLEGVKIQLFNSSGSVLKGDEEFEENQFSVVQELPYIYKYKGKKIF